MNRMLGRLILALIVLVATVSTIIVAVSLPELAFVAGLTFSVLLIVVTGATHL